METKVDPGLIMNNKSIDTKSVATNGDSSSSPESLCSSSLSSKTSLHNSDSEVPVLTPMNGDVNDANENKKRKADCTNSDAVKDKETKRPKREEPSPNNEDAPKLNNEVSAMIVGDHEPMALTKQPIKSETVLTDTASVDALTTEKKTPSPDSDKENVDAPIDLSLSVKPVVKPDIVAMLDEEQSKPKLNGYKELTTEQSIERKRLIKRLQDELRNEEAKLVLLKKIRQSQMLQPLNDTAAPGSKSVPHVPNRPSPSHSQTGINNKAAVPQHKSGYVAGSQGSQMNRSLVNSSSNQPRIGGTSSRLTQGPPQLVMAPTARGQSTGRSLPQSSSSHHIQSSARGSPQISVPSQPEQTPAQRQAAAKLALRKQLEKTLLQIPPPKPPPPEMNFIPSLAGNDFMVLVGLEEVVKFIVDIDAQSKGEKGPEVKYVFNPFVCVQCGTDFTPVWKRDKPGSKNVICEQCVTTNQKKALKQEHTNRLKSAFVKALQQEQEIEQRMQAQTSSTHRERERSERPERSERESHRERDREREHSSRRDQESSDRHRSSGHTSHGSSHSSHHGPSSTSNPVNLSTNYSKASTDQLRQHQQLLQAHQAQLRGAAALSGLAPSFNPRLMFPFSPQHLPASSKDLQRQILLDMIPHTMQGNNMLWRT